MGTVNRWESVDLKRVSRDRLLSDFMHFLPKIEQFLLLQLQIVFNVFVVLVAEVLELNGRAHFSMKNDVHLVGIPN